VSPDAWAFPYTIRPSTYFHSSLISVVDRASANGAEVVAADTDWHGGLYALCRSAVARHCRMYIGRISSANEQSKICSSRTREVMSYGVYGLSCAPYPL
jgi:hypothetical protein